MTNPVSLLLPYTGSLLPPANPVGLSDDEQRLVTGLSQKLSLQSLYVTGQYLYYHGEQRSQSLGVSIPQILANVRQVVGWPRVAVDRLIERVSLDGFRTPGSTEVDSDLQAIIEANDFGSELPLALQDSLVGGCGFMVVGSPDVAGDAPIITAESPLNMAVTWDPRTRSIRAAYQSYEVEGVYRAVLYLPDQSIFMSRDQFSPWAVDHRDQHGFGEVLVARFPNRMSSADREGRSEISPDIKAATDTACRALLGMDIAREFYSVPQKYVLGVDESTFKNPDGTTKTPLDIAYDKFMAFARDDNDDIPTVGQFTAYDPSVFTKIVDEQAQLVASYTGFPPQYFGLTNTANPTSADAIRVGLDGLDRGAMRVVQQANSPVRRLAQLAWRVANDGAELPAEMKRVAPDWDDTTIRTMAADSDALFKQSQMGAVTATSDVVLKRLGYNAVERARLAQDRDEASALIAALTSSEAAKEARTANAIAADLAGDNAVADAAAANPPIPPQSR